jgi:hypothetical protein
MPRPTQDRIDRSELPEFLRSKAIGAVVAEALLSPSNGDDWPDAYRTMVQEAAAEIRTFHGLPEPAPEIVRNGHLTDYQVERELGVDTQVEVTD